MPQAGHMHLLLLYFYSTYIYAIHHSCIHTQKTLSLSTHPIPRRHTIRRRQLGRIPPHRLSPIPTNRTLPTPRTAIQRARRICRRSLFNGDCHIVFGTVFVHEIFFNLENKFGGGISGICVGGDAREVAWGERVGLAGGPAGWWGGCCPVFLEGE